MSTSSITYAAQPNRYESGTPEWWRERLLGRINTDAPSIRLAEDYYDGIHRLAFATSKFKEAFGDLFGAMSDNWCRIVVDASTERLVIDGFRFGATDESADTDAWDIWQDCGLDAESEIAHNSACVTGRAYLLVGKDDDGAPRITLEHALSACVESHPTDHRRRLAGIRTWTEATGETYCVVYEPERITWFVRGNGQAWEPADGSGTNPLGVVPLVPLINNATISGRSGRAERPGRSDLADVIPVQDAVNKFVTDMLVASEFGAYRQRFATGIEIPVDPDTGQPMTAQYLSSISRMWTVEDPAARFGEFQASDLGNYVQAIDTMVRHLSAQSRTPPHYLIGQVVNASADALRAAEAGLVAKVKRKQLVFGEAWEEAMRLAFLVKGDAQRAEETTSEVIWRDPETRTEGERVDAITKLASVGVPQEALWARIPGVTPQQIGRWRVMAEQDALRQAASSIGSATDQGDPGGGVDAGAEERARLNELALAAQQLGLAIDRGVVSAEEARNLLRGAGAEVVIGPPPEAGGAGAA